MKWLAEHPVVAAASAAVLLLAVVALAGLTVRVNVVGCQDLPALRDTLYGLSSPPVRLPEPLLN